MLIGTTFYLVITFKNIILDGQYKFVPLQPKKSNKKPPWLKKNIHKEIKSKQVAYKQYLRTKSDIDLHNYQVQRNKTKDEIRKAKINHESSIIADLKSNPKQLHKFIRQKQKVKHTIGPLKKPDGSLTTANEESAEALASFVQFVFVHEDIQILPDFPSRVNNFIPSLVITEDLVYHKLCNLNITKANSPDDIYTFLLHTVNSCASHFVRFSINHCSQVNFPKIGNLQM